MADGRLPEIIHALVCTALAAHSGEPAHGDLADRFRNPDTSGATSLSGAVVAEFSDMRSREWRGWCHLALAAEACGWGARSAEAAALNELADASVFYRRAATLTGLRWTGLMRGGRAGFAQLLAQRLLLPRPRFLRIQHLRRSREVCM